MLVSESSLTCTRQYNKASGPLLTHLGADSVCTLAKNGLSPIRDSSALEYRNNKAFHEMLIPLYTTVHKNKHSRIYIPNTPSVQVTKGPVLCKSRLKH